MNDFSYFVSGTTLNTLYASDVNLASKEFLLEIWLDDATSPWRRMFTLRECLANVETLSNGCSFRIYCHFNRREIGTGVYCKQGNGMTVLKEEGVLVGLFTPFLQTSSSTIRH